VAWRSKYRNEADIGLASDQRGDLNDTHNLLELWKDCVRFFHACGSNHGDEAIEAVGKIVEQFDDWDKIGIAFRYAATKAGALAAFQHAEIDISNLQDLVEGVANFFSGSDGWLDCISNARGDEPQ